jgi:hypothetical protein
MITSKGDTAADEVEQFIPGHVLIGIDTHKHIHVAAVMDSIGGTLSRPTPPRSGSYFNGLQGLERLPRLESRERVLTPKD